MKRLRKNHYCRSTCAVFSAHCDRVVRFYRSSFSSVLSCVRREPTVAAAQSAPQPIELCEPCSSFSSASAEHPISSKEKEGGGGGKSVKDWGRKGGRDPQCSMPLNSIDWKLFGKKRRRRRIGRVRLNEMKKDGRSQADHLLMKLAAILSATYSPPPLLLLLLLLLLSRISIIEEPRRDHGWRASRRPNGEMLLIWWETVACSWTIARQQQQ